MKNELQGDAIHIHPDYLPFVDDDLREFCDKHHFKIILDHPFKATIFEATGTAYNFLRSSEDQSVYALREMLGSLVARIRIEGADAP